VYKVFIKYNQPAWLSLIGQKLYNELRIYSVNNNTTMQ